MSQQQSHSSKTDLIRTAKCPRCDEPMTLVLFEPAEMYGSRDDAFVFQCTCGEIREAVPRA